MRLGHRRRPTRPTSAAAFKGKPLLPLSLQVDRQSQFIQGYRVVYRQTSGLPAPGAWQTQDVKVSSERSVMLAGLKKGIVYEIKVRPFFNEFQGMDSESRTARTSEEGTIRATRPGVVSQTLLLPLLSVI